MPTVRLKITPERTKMMCDCVRMGGTYDAAARAGGINRTTLYDWLRKGDQGREPWATFAHEFKEAYHQAELQMLASVKAAALGKGVYERSPSWQAAAWLLERSRGYNRSGAAGALPLRGAPPKNETPHAERLRIAEELIEDARALGLSPDKMLPLYEELRMARVAVEIDRGDMISSQEDLIKGLTEFPAELLEAALQRRQNADDD